MIRVHRTIALQSIFHLSTTIKAMYKNREKSLTDALTAMIPRHTHPHIIVLAVHVANLPTRLNHADRFLATAIPLQTRITPHDRDHHPATHFVLRRMSTLTIRPTPFAPALQVQVLTPVHHRHSAQSRHLHRVSSPPQTSILYSVSAEVLQPLISRKRTVL
jgi:hypothetical protein